MGDPTTFIARNNEHFEIYDNFLIDRGEHRYKFGGYLFHLRFRPENPDTARGSFTYTGQFSGNSMADFLLGYPVAARSGVGGRGSEDARTTWLHLYAQDDWRVRDNLTVNYGLRYEINEHMRDVENRLSTIDFSVPGGRYVIASDDDGNISPDAGELLPLIPIPWVSSAETAACFAPARNGSHPVSDSRGHPATRPRPWYAAVMGSFSISGPTAYRQPLRRTCPSSS
jgi:hypothetical protein